MLHPEHFHLWDSTVSVVCHIRTINLYWGYFLTCLSSSAFSSPNFIYHKWSNLAIRSSRPLQNYLPEKILPFSGFSRLVGCGSWKSSQSIWLSHEKISSDRWCSRDCYLYHNVLLPHSTRRDLWIFTRYLLICRIKTASPKHPCSKVWPHN